MEGKMLDFPLFQVLWRIRLKWHAVIAHPSLPVSAHLFVSAPLYLAILLV